MLLFVGLPLFFMELAFGQYASEGPITIWKISPLFQGLGYAMFLMSAMVGVYYNMLIAWALFYLFSSFSSITSFTDKLPWSSCENEWNTMGKCRERENFFLLQLLPPFFDTFFISLLFETIKIALNYSKVNSLFG